MNKNNKYYNKKYIPEQRVTNEDLINEIYSTMLEYNTSDFLLNKNLNIINKQKQNLIHLVIIDPVLSKQLKYKLVYSLISNNVSFDSSDQDGNTPLILSCKHSLGAIVNLLVDKGANINKKNLDGFSPLLYLILGKKKNVNLIKLKH